MLDLQAYVRRIEYRGALEPTPTALAALHRAHMLAVPFENLSIHRGWPIVIDEATLFRKIIAQRRGGFCYELNGLFAALLRELGFRVTLLSARVAREAGDFGPEFDHLTLLVECQGRWLADVGFGDSFLEPLTLDTGAPQLQDGRAFRVEQAGELWTMQERDGEWRTRYCFTLQPRQPADFVPMCQFHQSAPESGFTKRRICSQATPSGRVTLSDFKLIITSNGERQEQQLEDEAAWAAALHQHFAISLQPEASN